MKHKIGSTCLPRDTFYVTSEIIGYKYGKYFVEDIFGSIHELDETELEYNFTILDGE